MKFISHYNNIYFYHRLLQFKLFKITLSLVFTLILSQSAYGDIATQIHYSPPLVHYFQSSNIKTDTNHKTSSYFAIQFNLKPDWKVYWRSPGDAGTPPKLSWKEKSINITSADFLWPLPKRVELLGFTTFGYGDQFMLPIAITPSNPEIPISLIGTIDYLVCKDVCVPLSFDFTANSQTKKPLATQQHLFSKTLQNVPHQIIYSSLEGVQSNDTSVNPSGIQIDFIGLNSQQHDEMNVWQMTLDITSNLPLNDDLDLWVELKNAPAWNKPSSKFISSDNQKHRVRLITEQTLDSPPNPDDTTILTLKNGEIGVEIQTQISNIIDHPPPDIQNSWRSYMTDWGRNIIPYIQIFLIALLGGLILNVMPCVLPVLSLKIIGLVDNNKSKMPLIMTALGIMFTFLLFALIAYGLKITGHAVGWGMQFQYPLFICFLILVISFFANSLLGFWDFNLPINWLNTMAKSFHPQSSTTAQTRNHISSFMTGVFATLLATPCSAPFLGTAISFAFVGDGLDILLIFMGLGLGMSAPYSLLAINPKFRQFLPKPGNWLNWIRPLLSLPLIITLIWLYFILKQQINSSYLQFILTINGLVFILFAAYFLYRKWFGNHGSSTIIKIVFKFMLIIFVLLFILASWQANQASPSAPQQKSNLNSKHSNISWQGFNPQAIDMLVQQGRVVFVNITADWCITCQINEINVMEDKQIIHTIKSMDAVMMKGDWTNPNLAISTFLQQYNRFGIPFNIIYSPKHPQGLVLSEILTLSETLDAFNQSQP